MSQAPSNPNEIGRATVAFVGDTSNVKKAAAETVAVTTAAARQAQAAIQSAVSVVSPYSLVEGGAYEVSPRDAGIVAAEQQKLAEAQKRQFDEVSDYFVASMARNRIAAKSMANAVDDAGDTVEKSGRKASAPWRFILTTVGGVVGGFVAVARAAQGIVTVLESGEAKAARFMMALKDEGGAKSLQAVEDRLTKLATIQDGGGNIVTDFMDIVRDTAGLAADEIDALTKLKATAQQKAMAEQTKAELDAQAKIAADAKRIRDEAFMATLDEGQKITANEAKKIKEIEALRKDARTEENQKALDDATKYVKEAARIEMQQYEQTMAQKRVAERQAEEERRRDFEETARKQAEDIEKQLGRAISSIQQAAANMFPTDKLSLQLTELAKIMERVASNTRNING